MKRIDFLLFLLLFAFISCDRDTVHDSISYQNYYDTALDSIQFSSDGGKDTIDIPFDDCYLHFVRNNDSYLFFYLMESDYTQLDSIIEERSIIVEPKKVDPLKGFYYFEWDWLTVQLKDNKAFISVKENDTRAARTADIALPNRNLKRLDIKISQDY